VRNNDDDAMVELVEQYLADDSWRSEMSRCCREFAVSQFAWPLIAQRHLNIYETLSS